MHTFSTVGLILTVAAVLLSSLAIVTTWKCWRVVRALLASMEDLLSTQEEKAPTKWESRLRELADEVVSLSSSYEKAQKLLLKLNSRAGMRELRASSPESQAAPPQGASKAELRRYYVGAGVDHREFAKRQLSLVPNNQESNQ